MEGLEVGEEELVGSDERTVVVAVRKSVADGPECDGTTTSVHEVLEEDVLHILHPHTSGTQHGEAALHEEHKTGSVEDVRGRDGVLGFCDEVVTSVDRAREVALGS